MAVLELWLSASVGKMMIALARRMRTLALLALLLASISGSGLTVRHGTDHAHDPELAEAPRFDPGHDTPISDQHVEAAHRLPEEDCFACALRSPSSGNEPLGYGRAPWTPPIVAPVLEHNRLPAQNPVRLRPGRAPPARLQSPLV